MVLCVLGQCTRWAFEFCFASYELSEILEALENLSPKVIFAATCDKMRTGFGAFEKINQPTARSRASKGWGSRKPFLKFPPTLLKVAQKEGTFSEGSLNSSTAFLVAEVRNKRLSFKMPYKIYTIHITYHLEDPNA